MDTENDISQNTVEDAIHSLENVIKTYQNKQKDTLEANASLYSLERMKQTIEQLPEQMEQWYELYQQREKRKQELERIQEEFIQSFLVHPKKQYYYIPRNEVFLMYDGFHAQVIDEDTIWHTILSILSNQSHPLFSRRYMVKVSLMHRIKQRSILGITPSSYTIQYILDFLVPTFLKDKSHGKYFLTILGDMILKKNSEIFLLDSKCKNFIDSLERLAYFYWSGSIHLNEGFKFKYYEHDYNKCRLIRFNNTVEKEQLWHPFIKSYILDLIVVATHYSQRFGSADRYLASADDNVREYALFLKNHSEQELVSQFISDYLEQTDNQSIQINWRQMIYLWKQYLSEKGLPTIMMSHKLRSQLQENGLTLENEIFKGVSSIYLHTVKDFERFWSEWIVQDETEHIETSEMATCYGQWSQAQRTAGCSVAKLNEDKIISFVEYFHSENTIQERMICGVKCKQWNRKEKLETVWNEIKQEFKEQERANSIHWTELYEILSTRMNKISSNVPNPNTTYVYNWLREKQLIDTVDWIDSDHWN